MKNLHSRLLVFFIGIPLIVGLTIFVTWFNNIGINLLCVIATFSVALEVAAILNAKKLSVGRWFLATFSSGVPLLTYFYVIGILPSFNYIFLYCAGCIAGFFIASLFSEDVKEGRFDAIISHMGADLIGFIYPSFFISFIVLFSTFEQSTAILVLFFLTIFMNDSFAWLFGVLFGKSTRGYIKVSPKKSLIGFAGGITFSTAVCTLAPILLPEIFPYPIFIMTIFGFVAGFTTILGDLVESGFKRSAAMKDSGHSMPGRGGILDSIDSMLFTAPLFYLFFSLVTG